MTGPQPPHLYGGNRRLLRLGLLSVGRGSVECLESRKWQVFAGEVGLFGGLVCQCLVGSDGVVDDAEAMNFHVKGVAIADVAAKQVLVFQGAEEPLDDAVGLW